MHPIAKRFSPEARQAIVEAFSVPATKMKYHPGGLCVKYDDIWCCPLGVGLFAEGKDTTPMLDTFLPDVDFIAGQLVGVNDPAFSEVVEEARDFINSYKPGSIIEAFEET